MSEVIEDHLETVIDNLQTAINLITGQKRNVFTPACENVLKAADCFNDILRRLPPFTGYENIDDYYRDFQKSVIQAIDDYGDYIETETNIGKSE